MTLHASSLRRTARSGFTLIEMLIVVALVGILASIAMPQFKNSVLRAKEAVLREDLWVLRDVIDQFYTDKGKYPTTPDELVDSGYIRRIPVDPVSGAEWLWTQAPLAVDEGEVPGEQGITDVHSQTPGLALDGSNYSEW